MINTREFKNAEQFFENNSWKLLAPKLKMHEIENIALEGGGVRGLIYLGVFIALEELGILENIKQIGGASIGALMAVGIAMGYDPKELAEISLKRQRKSAHNVEKISRFQDFIPDDPTNYYPHNVKSIPKKFYNIIKSLYNSFQTWGIFYGQHIEDSVSKFISDKFPGQEAMTFGEHHKLKLAHPELNLKDLRITTVNIANGCKLEELSWETTPDMQIRKAVHCSMAVPFVYKPVEHFHKIEVDGKTQVIRKLYVDSGIFSNLPLHVFKELNKTLGVSVSSLRHIEKIPGKPWQTDKLFSLLNDINNLIGIPHKILKQIKRICLTPLFTEDKMHQTKNGWRILKLKAHHIPFFNFNLSEKHVQDMIDLGRQATLDYFQKEFRLIQLKNIWNVCANIPVLKQKFYQSALPEKQQDILKLRSYLKTYGLFKNKFQSISHKEINMIEQKHCP